LADPITPADLRRGFLAQLSGDLEAAEALYRRAIADPRLEQAASRHLIHLLDGQHRWEEALQESRAALGRDPGAHALQVHMAMQLLALGRYAESWPLYDGRAALDTSGVRPSTAPYPEWDGAPIRSLVVWDEQGFGDAIQFSRFIPQLVASGVEVTFAVRPELALLFDGLGARILPSRGPMQVPIADAWAMVGSLPRWLGVTLEHLPGPTPYLAAPPERLAFWAGRLAGARIGVVTKGKAGHANDANRSLPYAAQGFLLSLPGAVNLLPEESDLPLKDFADTAAALEALDLVIAVDTAVAHLAGAMGKPCWLLLPYVGTDWRWLHERSDSPWYPSLRLYRQAAPGDWASVLRAVAQDLPSFFGQR
jgi:tetratricopeptide (TPR) repeat protein